MYPFLRFSPKSLFIDHSKTFATFYHRGLKSQLLPLYDAFRNWCMTEEAEIIYKKLVTIT